MCIFSWKPLIRHVLPNPTKSIWIVLIPNYIDECGIVLQLENRCMVLSSLLSLLLSHFVFGFHLVACDFNDIFPVYLYTCVSGIHIGNIYTNVCGSGRNELSDDKKRGHRAESGECELKKIFGTHRQNYHRFVTINWHLVNDISGNWREYSRCH